MTAIGYAYPWDAVPGLVDRVPGLDAVAVAASYHATRAASPLDPARRLVDVAHAAWAGRTRT